VDNLVKNAQPAHQTNTELVVEDQLQVPAPIACVFQTIIRLVVATNGPYPHALGVLSILME